ncbi:MAG: DUF4115 domain-containing protein [Sulfuriferula sp.]|nr:DUF4115 domain-containing protein [Sulfuriferula sp.]
MESAILVDAPTVGEQLRSARTAMQLSITDIAQHLKLSAIQIERLENNDFASAGIVFSRGFVRQYARHVGLNADDLVPLMTAHRETQESLQVHNEQIPLSQGLSKYWLILVSLTISIVIAIPLGIYYWLSSDSSTVASAPPVAHIAPATSVTAITAPITAKIPAPATPASVPAAVDTPKASSVTTDNTNAGHLAFKFDGDAWVEIRDADSRIVLSHLYRAGETADISAPPPLSLVVGNAAKVSLLYNDQAVDLKTRTGITVARFSLK